MFTCRFFMLRSLYQGHAPLNDVLITILLARKDSGAAESFSEGHLWLTVPGRPCHPASMVNEQTQGFSLRLIIVTMNEFQVLLVVVLSALSSHQPVNHLSPQNKPSRHKHRCTLSTTRKHRYTRTHTKGTHPHRKSDQLIKMWWLSGK